MSLNLTTPKTINASVRKLCDKVRTGSDPIYVPVRPSIDAIPSECFSNVERHMEQHGGECLLGWQVWEWPGVFAEAELHAIWQSPDGELVDITPKVDGETAILFVRDPAQSIPKQRVPNIKLPIGNSELIRDYLKLTDLGFDVVQLATGPISPMMVHYGAMLEEATHIVRLMLLKGRKTSSKCICGGHMAYGDCHRDDVKDTIASLTKWTASLKQ